jgi:hypothetical protein
MKRPPTRLEATNHRARKILLRAELMRMMQMMRRETHLLTWVESYKSATTRFMSNSEQLSRTRGSKYITHVSLARICLLE